MPFRIARRALAVWAGILTLAILNGFVRDIFLIPTFGTVAGFLSSGVILSSLILIVAYLSLPWLGARRFLELVGVGWFWVALTLAFEFSFGLWQGKSWHVMFEAYTFNDGNIWPVVLVVTAAAPYLSATLRRWA